MTELCFVANRCGCWIILRTCGLMQAGLAGESGTAISARLAIWTSGRAHSVVRGISDPTYISVLVAHRECFTGVVASTIPSTVALKAVVETRVGPACQARRIRKTAGNSATR
jgi:hypothetical protein